MIRTSDQPHAAEPVTVVMPVYNAMPYLDAAIASVMAQAYPDFTLAIYDDGSTDGSYEAALGWQRRDARLILERGVARLGPSGSSNAAARMARTELVARMDADDIMLPDRLATQVEAMRAFPGAVLLGSIFDMIDARGKLILKALPGRTGGAFPPIAHPSVMYRRSIFEAVGGYRAVADFFEDRDLFMRLAARGDVVIVNRPLLQIRFAGQHTRLSENPGEVIDKVNRLYCDAPGENGTRSISPMAFYSIAILGMFSGRRPGILRLMIRRVRFDQPVLLAAVAAMIALAEASPRAARGAWRIANALRHALVSSAPRRDGVYVWRPTATTARAVELADLAGDRSPEPQLPRP